MSVVFRTDASLQIGTGHVMRCMTLADELASKGANCHFICREHKGHLLDMIRDRGYLAVGLPSSSEPTESSLESDIEDAPSHSSWLGADWLTDLDQTKNAIGGNVIDWLIVDHYALDMRWEGAMRNACKNLMVIDDLADRKHDCDLLLDQNFGRASIDYDDLVPVHCNLLIGPRYALLRAEFAKHRNYSLSRRIEPQLKHLLITMGGVDQIDATSQILEALKNCLLPNDCKITVVMGFSSPWVERVRVAAAELSWPTKVMVNINEMARVMADSDLAIGAAGSTAWERACLGLPSFTVVLAHNQKEAAQHMEAKGVSKLIPLATDLPTTLCQFLNEMVAHPSKMTSMAEQASRLTDGKGSRLILDKITSLASQ